MINPIKARLPNYSRL